MSWMTGELAFALLLPSGVEFHVVDIDGTDAGVVDLSDEQGLPSLSPGMSYWTITSS